MPTRPPRWPTTCARCWRSGSGEMARRGRRDEAVAALREAFGERRAEIVAAAMMPETGTTPEPAEKPREKPHRDPSDQADLFDSGTGTG